MKIAKVNYVLLLTLISFVGTLLINGCGGTIPAAPHIPGCFTKCRYFENTGPADAKDCEFKGQTTRVEHFCTSEKSCNDIVRTNYQKQICGSQFPTYSDIDWDGNTQTCGRPDQPYPENQNSTCLPVDGKICSDPSIPKICVCDESVDDDCDGVPDGQDQCREELDPIHLEDPDEWMTDGCADIDNDQDGICDPWVVSTHQEAKYFKSRGCVGDMQHCCQLDGADVCATQKCDPTGNPSRCSDPANSKYGCKPDVDLIPANDFSAKISISYGTEGTENQAVAHFLSFGSGETGYPHYNEATYSIEYGDKVVFAKDLRVRWTVKSTNTADALPQLDPLSGETGWDGSSGKPQSLKLKFVDQKTVPRDHPIQYEVSAEILDLDKFVDGVATIKPLTIGQTGADQCVQKGLDGGTPTTYTACHYEGLKIKALQFTSDHQDAGGNLLKRGQEDLWSIGERFNTAADPYEFRFADSRNNPISHSYGDKLVVKVDIEGISNGDKFTLEGKGAFPYANFAKISSIWNGPLTMTAVAALPFTLGILSESIEWTVVGLDKAGQAVSEKKATTGPHKIYVTYEMPIETTTLPSNVTVRPPWLSGTGKRFAAENKLTDKKLDILLAPYSEETWGIAGGLSEEEDIVKAVHKFLNNANIIITPNTKTCFAADGKKEYMWSAFSSDYSLRCFERAFLMEIFMGTVGIKAKGLQIHASNTSAFPLEYMSQDIEFKTRGAGEESEWLLMDFGAPSSTAKKINVGEGSTLVDVNQGIPTVDEKFFPHAVGEKDDPVRESLVAKSACGVMKRLRQALGFDFQRWCKKSDGVTWDCSDREPLQTCTE